jgi:hypothetical protein
MNFLIRDQPSQYCDSYKNDVQIIKKTGYPRRTTMAVELGMSIEVLEMARRNHEKSLPQFVQSTFGSEWNHPIKIHINNQHGVPRVLTVACQQRITRHLGNRIFRGPIKIQCKKVIIVESTRLRRRHI